MEDTNKKKTVKTSSQKKEVKTTNKKTSNLNNKTEKGKEVKKKTVKTTGENKPKKTTAKKSNEIKKEVVNFENVNISIDKKFVAQKKYNNLIFIAILIIISFILLAFACNKTFFRKNYTNSKFTIDIPFFMYFINDEDNTITFKTLRKTEYITDYFDETSNLGEFDYYNCGDHVVFYKPEDKLVLYDINIKKGFALKTVKISYGIKDLDYVCE